MRTNMSEEQPVTFSRSPPAIKLPSDGDDANAAVLAFVRGDADYLPRAALEAMRQRIEALRDPTADDSLDELARQLPTLEALWLRFAAEATAATVPDTRAKYLRMALQAQQGYARTFALLRGLTLQQRGRAAVAVIDEEGG